MLSHATRRPQPDQLAEHLADLGRGDEVAVGADARRPLPVAVLGIGEADLHVAVDGHGPVAGDDLAQALEQRGCRRQLGRWASAGAGAGRFAASRKIHRPMAIIGSE